MRVGDILVKVKEEGDYNGFTIGKQYIIYRVDEPDSINNPTPGHYCGWITNESVNCSYYFKEENATDEYWKYLKDYINDQRKEKLEKLNECCVKD